MISEKMHVKYLAQYWPIVSTECVGVTIIIIPQTVCILKETENVIGG